MQVAIEVTKVAIMVVRETYKSGKNARLIHTMTGSSSVAELRQPTFDWKASDRSCATLKMDVKSISMTNNYNTQESVMVQIILNLLGWEGWHQQVICSSKRLPINSRFIQILNDEEKEKCRTSIEMIKVFSNKFKTTA